MKKYRSDIIAIGISFIFALACFGIYPLLDAFYLGEKTIKSAASATADEYLSSEGLSSTDSFNSNPKVIIQVDGQLYGTYDLLKDQTVEVNSKFGHNTVMIKDGRAYVTDADCPDGQCISDSMNGDFLREIICLPNRMVLRFEYSDEESYDAIAY